MNWYSFPRYLATPARTHESAYILYTFKLRAPFTCKGLIFFIYFQQEESTNQDPQIRYNRLTQVTCSSFHFFSVLSIELCPVRWVEDAELDGEEEARRSGCRGVRRRGRRARQNRCRERLRVPAESPQREFGDQPPREEAGRRTKIGSCWEEPGRRPGDVWIPDCT